MPTTLSCLSTNAARGFLAKLVPAFEQSSGHRVAITNSSTNEILRRVEAGESADVVIATVEGLDKLAALGKVDGASRARLGSTRVGVGVIAGAPKPDISTPQAFKQALLAAKSITYTTLGQSGVHFANVMRTLGIEETLKPRLNVIPGGLVGEIVVRGEAELGVQMLSEIAAVPGFELVGPFPPELQEVTTFAAAQFCTARDVEAAQAFIRFLASPDSARVMRSLGFD